MKKIFTLCFLLAALSIAAQAQSFAFFRNGAQLENGAVVTVTNYTPTLIPSELEIPAGLSLKNITNASSEVRVRQTILEYTGSGDNLINWCFNVCSNVPVTTTTLDRTSVIAANSFEENFHANYIVYPGEWTSISVRYDVFVANATFADMSIIVNFVYDQNSQPSSLEGIKASSCFSFSQNDGKLSFNYTIGSNMTLEIFNITGEKIVQHQLIATDNQFILPEMFHKGIYIYAVKYNNTAIVTRKFIVQ